jgi:hypothetical protein
MACLITDQIDAQTYWYYERYEGVEVLREVGGRRTGRRRSANVIQGAGKPYTRCVVVPLSGLDDPRSKELGSWRALVDLFQRISPGAQDWNANEWSVRARESLRKLVAPNFSSPSAFSQWFDANLDYLAWSPKSERFELDEAAKAAGNPLRQGRLDAMRYWYGRALGILQCAKEEGAATIRCREWTGMHPPLPVRLSPARMEELLADREAKEQAYRDAVRKLIEDLQPSEPPPPTKRDTGRAAKDAIRQLEVITGESFDTPAQWMKWWTTHANQLHLSKDGQRLVVVPTRE